MVSRLNTFIQWLFLFVGTFVIFYKPSIAYNEMDVLPYAKSVFDPNWLSNDWYLSRKIPYRYLFSYPTGYLISTIGFVKTMIFGRILSYAVFAFAFQYLIKAIDKKNNIIYYLGIIVFFILFPNGNGAHEWMVGGFDTKVFSYAFVLYALASLLKNNLKNLFIFSGLALSFHILIGGYAMICLILPFFLQKKELSVGKLIKLSPWFLVFGAVGIYGLIYQLTASAASSEVNQAWGDIYVKIRVHDHTYPKSFVNELWIKWAIFMIVNLVVIIYEKGEKIKQLAAYGFSSGLISLIGLIIFWFDQTHLLKYYFFRFADVILPLTTILICCYYILQLLKTNVVLRNKFYNVGLYVVVGVLITIITISNKENYIIDQNEILLKKSGDIEMENWIREHTDKNDVFIVNPNVDYFYIYYQRPVFVIWKYAPQNGEDLIEWDKRLKFLNKNKPYSGISELEKSYTKLNEEDIDEIVNNYPNVKYLMMIRSAPLNYPIAHQTRSHNLYMVN